MKTFFTACLVLLLCACAGGPSGGGSEIYGEIKTGVETSRTRVGN